MEYPNYTPVDWSKQDFSIMPDGGILLQGTSLNRARSIQKNWFDPLQARGFTIDEYSNHFFYFNPSADFTSGEHASWTLRFNAEWLYHYAHGAVRGDITEGKEKPVILVMQKPPSVQFNQDTMDRARRIPVLVSLDDVPRETQLQIAPLSIDKKSYDLSDKESDRVIKTICKALKKLQSTNQNQK